MRRPRALPVTLAGALALGACASAPVLERGAVEVPDHYLATTATVAPDAATPWWRAFDDALLTTLVEEGLSHNLEIRVALARLDAARVYERGSVSALAPTIVATAGGGHGTGVDESKGRVDTPFGAGLNSRAVPDVERAGGFDAVWQLDVFGRTRLALQGAAANTRLLEAGRDAVRQAVAANIGEAYLRYRQAQMVETVLTDAVRIAEQASGLAEARYRAGIRNGLDAEVARRESETLAADLAVATATRVNARTTLAVLLGRYPEDIDERLASVAPVPTATIAWPALSPPVELLRRRPDLRQSQARWQLAAVQTGLAHKDLLPRLALTGVVGMERGTTAGAAVTSAHVWSVGPAMTWPLLDFGALDAAIEAAHDNERAALDEYRQRVMEAVAEVDRHRMDLTAAREAARHLEAAALASDAALQLAKARYEAGLSDFAAYADSEREAARAKLAYANALATTGIDLLRLHVALGGGWPADPTPAKAYRPSPAIIALFTRGTER